MLFVGLRPGIRQRENERGRESSESYDPPLWCWTEQHSTCVSPWCPRIMVPYLGTNYTLLASVVFRRFLMFCWYRIPTNAKATAYFPSLGYTEASKETYSYGKGCKSYRMLPAPPFGKGQKLLNVLYIEYATNFSLRTTCPVSSASSPEEVTGPRATATYLHTVSQRDLRVHTVSQRDLCAWQKRPTACAF